MQTYNLFIISDSVGETAQAVAKAAAAQFVDAQFHYERFPFVRTESLIDTILDRAVRENATVIHTFADTALSAHVNQFCEAHHLAYSDVLTPVLNTLADVTGLTSANQPGTTHNLDTTYFDKIDAIEFAVTYDDGKDPSGFLQADVVLLGVSRTSKTPLSLYLANRGIRVANLPLVPKAQIPDEIWHVDPAKIIGLTNDPKILNDIRRNRMIAYGLNPDTDYSSMDKIQEELNYANDLFKKIGCLVINVANKSIEETATLITESLGLDDATNQQSK